VGPQCSAAVGPQSWQLGRDSTVTPNHYLLRTPAPSISTLSTNLPVCCSSGRWLPDSFADLPLPQREAVLLGWATGSDMRMRKAFKGLKSLIMSTQFTYLTPEGNSDLLAALRYPVIDPERPPSPAPAALAAEAAVAAAVVDLSDRDSSPGSAAGAGAALAAAGLRVAWPSDFQSGAVSREKCQVVCAACGMLHRMGAREKCELGGAAVACCACAEGMLCFCGMANLGSAASSTAAAPSATLSLCLPSHTLLSPVHNSCSTHVSCCSWQWSATWSSSAACCRPLLLTPH
jgi:hypothetical protein